MLLILSHWTTLEPYHISSNTVLSYVLVTFSCYALMFDWRLSDFFLSLFLIASFCCLHFCNNFVILSYFLTSCWIKITVTVTTGTCSDTIRPMAHSRVSLVSVSSVSSMKQKTRFTLEWMMQLNARVSSQLAADSMHAVRQQRKPCHQSSDSFVVRPRHSYTMNAVTTVKECQRRASTGWQCNRQRARRTSCAQAGTACTVFSLWSATSATPAK